MYWRRVGSLVAISVALACSDDEPADTARTAPAGAASSATGTPGDTTGAHAEAGHTPAPADTARHEQHGVAAAPAGAGGHAAHTAKSGAGSGARGGSAGAGHAQHAGAQPRRQ